MTFTARVLKDSFNSFEIVIHKDGIAVPTMIISDYEFRLLIEQVDNEKKRFTKRKGSP